MKTTIATRFRCSSPSTDLLQKTLMFDTLILQYLNELVEGEIGDLTSPKFLHALQVQSFNGDCVESLTKIGGELPMKVFALVGDFSIKPCEFTNSTPPTARTFLLTAQCFVEFAEFRQGLFQRLWVLYLLTRAKRQICVFHTEVCPNALTCCRQRFKIRVGCDDVKPIVSTGISLDGDTTNSSVPLAVFMESIRDFIKSPLTLIPLAKCEGDTIVFQRPTRFSWIGDRLKLVSLFDFRSTTEFLEKSVIRCVNPSQLLLDRLARQGVPMWVCGFLKFSEVRAHCRVVRIRQPVFIPLTMPFMEILMHLPHIVKQITNAYCVQLFTQRVFIGFHGFSRITPLTPL